MNIAVYCGNAEVKQPEWHEGARATGRWIGTHSATLVYGGVEDGLARSLVTEAKASGGEIVGVVPMRRRELRSKLNSVDIPTSSLDGRKNVMQLLADVFVVLPGGYGTLDALTSAFATLNFTNRRDRRIILFNPGGLYDPLLEMLDKMASTGLMEPACIELLQVVDTPQGICEALDRFFNLVSTHRSTAVTDGMPSTDALSAII